MPINAGYEYFDAEKKYGLAQTTEEKIVALENMIKVAPKHKSSENLLAELRLRLKKLREKQEKSKKVGKGKAGIKKEGFQVVLLGFANVGKSSLLAALTNARPAISQHPFTTKEPELGTMDYNGVKAQIVDLPSVGAVGFDIGLVNTADCILLVIEKIENIPELEKLLGKTYGKKVIVLTKFDSYSNDERRKIEARFSSKKVNAVFTSSCTGEGIDSLKRRIFESMDSIRVFTKEPGKSPSPMPVVLPKGSIVRDVAESILKGFSLRVRETRVTGPSAKFANQKVGLQHGLKDMDVVEFHTS